MTALASSVIDLGALWKILVAGLVGGAGVVVAFGFVLLGRSRYLDARGEGEGIVLRAGYLLMTALGATVCATALVLGFLAMTKK